MMPINADTATARKPNIEPASVPTSWPWPWDNWLLTMAIEALEIGQRDDYDPDSAHDAIAERIDEINAEINELG